MTFLEWLGLAVALFRITTQTLDVAPPALLSWSSQSTSTPGMISLVSHQPSSDAPVRVLNNSLGVDVTAAAALAVDTKTKTVVWQKNPDTVRPIASITKLMTALVILDASYDPEKELVITKDDFSTEAYNNFLIGERVRAEDVLTAAMVASDNTAARALARSTGMSAEEFVTAMNDRARSLGLQKTVFADPTGLSDKNISTAREVATLAQAAFARPELRALTATRQQTVATLDGRRQVIRSTNWLIGSMIKITAGKTGYVSESGYNLVAESDDKGHRILIVILGSNRNEDRFQDYKMLAWWVWHNFTWPE